MEKLTCTCCHCGQAYPLESCVLVGDDALCERCANEGTVICSRCGERIYRDNNAGDENTPLCSPAMTATIPAASAAGVSSMWMMPTMRMTMKMSRSAISRKRIESSFLKNYIEMLEKC